MKALRTTLDPAALNNNLLLETRWLLGGESKDPAARGSHLWHDILKVDEAKQYMFIQRIIFLHQVASRRAGRASTVKLSVSEWCTECDSMCVFTHTLQEMHRACDDSGNRLFSEDLLGNIKNRGLEGYLH